MDILFESHYYQGGTTLCRLFKEGNQDAIRTMAVAMSRLVPPGVVLVPIPSRYGYATDTLTLASEIAKLAKVPVADILKGYCRQSNYFAKKEGHPLSIDDLGFHKTGNTDLTPCFIDNVYDTGVTMQSAYKAFGKGIGLVYSVVE